MSVCGLGTAAAAEGDMLDVAKLMAPAEGYVDHILGDAAAPVTVIEYASVTCPHCATFSNDVYPAFKSAYIDSGKVRFVLRPFMRNTEDARVFMIAEAAQREKYHEVIEAYFKRFSSVKAYIDGLLSRARRQTGKDLLLPFHVLPVNGT